MHERTCVIATAGHVDHGKSALVRALTDCEPDRLIEEKRRGITIELGFSHFVLPSRSPSASRLNIAIVDVPGHEDFVRKMVAGVGAIQAALVAVACDDGWMPQTEEHFEILEYLRVPRVVIALTKVDLVRDIGDVRRAIHKRLTSSSFAAARIVPVSTRTGQGIEELKDALRHALERAPGERTIGKPRVWIDRAFVANGAGTIVTGSLTGGVLRAGEAVIAFPTGCFCRIRRIECHGQNCESASPGTRVALNLVGVEVEAVGRGALVTCRDLGSPSSTLDVAVHISSKTGRSLRTGVRLRLHYGTANIGATLVLGACEKLSPGLSALAILRLDVPVFAFVGDRFVLRDWSQRLTLAGGVVLDADAKRRRFRTVSRISWLTKVFGEVSAGNPPVAAYVARDIAVPCSELLLKSRWSAEQIQRALARTANQSNVRTMDGLVVDAAAWSDARARAIQFIRAAYAADTQCAGVPLVALAEILRPEVRRGGAFVALIASLQEDGFERVGYVVRASVASGNFSASFGTARAHLMTQLEAAGFNPPPRRQLAAGLDGERTVSLLVAKGELILLGQDVVFDARKLCEAVRLIREFIGRHGPASVSDLRRMLASSRRVMVPLLEYLDKTEITTRTGDRRRLAYASEKS